MRASYEHRFVRGFPDNLEDGILYVSMDFAQAAHRCLCGCGQEVYTRFTPRDWQMLFDGESVSVTPSIGNWSFACQSHYWLDHGRVRWASRMTAEEIEAVRGHDRRLQAQHYQQQAAAQSPSAQSPPPRKGLVGRLFDLFRGR
ncbi:MAG: hypothetical protein JHD15_07760 [Phenylobacterium sp.]|jgi:hypothetical protein|nr:DUF6527 family protein [Phenylobacterium sp.]MBJ7410247.1 hypothetical protein [Phenylobacterium sp.]